MTHEVDHYTELDRVFVELRDDGSPTESTLARAIASRAGQELDWEKVLANRCVVVLGEPRTGKTTEFRQQAKRMLSKNRTAFFVRIEELAARGLAGSLLPAAEAAFGAWRDEDDTEAFFFLDSVDEAKLRDHSLERALRNLCREVGDVAGPRARIAISCRTSDWLPQVDGAAIREMLGHWWKEENLSPNAAQTPLPTGRVAASARGARVSEPRLVRVFTLAPLSPEQVAKLAATRGIADVPAFLSAIGRSDAWHLAERPGDLEWLAVHWARHRRLGDLNELLAENVRRKLEEQNPGRRQKESLSPDDALAGAKTLAAAVMLYRSSSILVPEARIDPRRVAESIEPSECLPGWNTWKVQMLLGRGIFDEATYGRVRFHHESVVEYLTALWFRDRLAGDSPVEEVERFLFARRYGVDVLVPSMAGVTAWLAGFDGQIRKRVLRVAPETFLEKGDPALLAVAEREKILRKIVGGLAKGRRWSRGFGLAPFARFAAPELGPTVNELLARHRQDEEVCRLLLDLVWSGRISGAIESVLAVVTDTSTQEALRISAVEAIEVAGTERHLETLAKWCLAVGEHSAEMAAALAAALFPRVLDVEALADLLRRSRAESPTRAWRGHYAMERLIRQQAGRDTLAGLIRIFLPLATEPPLRALDDAPLASERYSWLVYPIAALLDRILKEVPEKTPEMAELVPAVRLLERCSETDHDWRFAASDVEKSLGGISWLHRALFWGRVEEIRASGGEPEWFGAVFAAPGRALWKLEGNDLEWLVEDVRDRSVPNDRLLALMAALRLWHEERDPGCLGRIRAAAAAAGLSERLEGILNPPPVEETERERERELRERGLERERMREEDQIRFRREARAALLSAEAKPGLLLALRDQYRGHDNRLGGDLDWEHFRNELGEDVVEPARRAFATVWKGWRPPFLHQLPDPSKIEGKTIVGLTGLGVAVASGLDFGSLSEEEARTAAHYAVREINGFPDWLPSLAAAWPAVVTAVLSECATGEFRIASKGCAAVLSDLASAPSDICDLIALPLEDLLEREEPVSLDALRDSLRAVFGSTVVNRERMSTLARKRFEVSRSDPERALVWLGAWLRVDGETAAIFLEKEVARNRAEVASLITGLANGMHWPPGLHADGVTGDWLGASVLRRLIPVTYVCIRPEDDQKHEGSWTPDARDNAQSFRSMLVNRLSETSGEEAYRALVSLARHPATRDSRDYYLYAARRRAALDAEPAPLRPRDVADLAKRRESAPKSAAELFTICLGHLAAVKRDVETGDRSPRGWLQQKTSEREFTTLVVRELETRARGRYLATDNEEIDGAVKPDVRVRASSIPAAVGIENKIANRWSYAELEGALRHQLIGNYLRAVTSRHGVFLLARTKEKTWRPSSGSRLDFESLCVQLQKVASRLVRGRPDLSEVRIIGINFLPPLRPRHRVRPKRSSKQK